MSMNFSELKAITGGEVDAFAGDRPVSTLLTDSRKPVLHEGSVFFAICGPRHDGHDFIDSLYRAGIRQFVVEKKHSWENYPEANCVKVTSSITALQQLSAYHRKQFSMPVIGITGSNGKTIIKEWLYQLLSPDFNVIKNPGSYNSQLGVPLSVWQLETHHQLGIFEAGISKPDEMENLQKVIQPTLGVFTMIGTSHDENFTSRREKINEKLKLFKQVDTLIYCSDHFEIQEAIQQSAIQSLSWGTQAADIRIIREYNTYHIAWNETSFSIQFLFDDAASVENAMHCIAVMLVLKQDPTVISERIRSLRSVPMRLELKEGINSSKVIDDSYNNDLGGLKISLDFLEHQKQKNRKALILSDIQQSGLLNNELVQNIASMVNACGVSRFIGVGPVLSAHKELFTVPSRFFDSTEEFLHSQSDFHDEIILVKGARNFEFEKIVRRLEKKVHGTILEVNLGAVVHNLNFFKSKLKSGTKLMVMVKAFAYGSGSIEIANLLQYHKVNYLGVAYADEGVELRQNNITTPIMVMNPSAEGFQSMLQYNLEPEIYSFKILEELILFLAGRSMSIHLKLDTGMHRLGFNDSDAEDLIQLLKKNQNLKVVSIFSHLAGSDEPQHDDFSKQQVSIFQSVSKRIADSLNINPINHILNTPGILRLPEFQMDMVRLGIGLYGIDPTAGHFPLKPAVALKTIISQIRNISKGESVGYGRKGIADKPLRIATMAIGYADGYHRAFSRGVGEVLVNGFKAKIIGNVCMDMTMIDITGIDVQEGDEVIIFGVGLPIEEVAAKINTIPYEILTSASERVKRIFVAEGI